MDTTTPAISSATPPVDAHGQAALLLVESLIHGLYEGGTLNVAQAVDIIERAREVQADYVNSSDDVTLSMRRSYDLLSNIAASLETEVVSAPSTLPLVE